MKKHKILEHFSFIKMIILTQLCQFHFLFRTCDAMSFPTYKSTTSRNINTIILKIDSKNRCFLTKALTKLSCSRSKLDVSTGTFIHVERFSVQFKNSFSS